MQTHCLHQVSVWLDDLSSDKGAFPEAMDWACRLNLPLRAVVTSTRFASQAFANQALNQDHQGNGPAPKDREPAPILEKIKSWGNACADRGIIMETSFWVGESGVGIEQFLRPWGLCVIEENRSDPVRQKLLARSMRNPEVVLLLTPPIYKRLTRVLVLYEHQNRNPSFLETAARLCLALEVQPLILTTASSERQARLKQSFAEGVCASLHLQADFDSVVAFEARAAAGQVAAWRHCSHVIVERPHNTSLWQRLRGDVFWQHLRGDIFSELRSLAGSLTLLGLPEGVILEVPGKVRDNRLQHSQSDPAVFASRQT